MVDEGKGGREVEVFAGGREGDEIGAGEFEEGHGGRWAIFLEVDEGAGELDEAFVEGAFGSFADGEPEVFKDVVGFVKELAVEVIEVGGEVGIDGAALMMGNHGGDFLALTHAGRG